MLLVVLTVPASARAQARPSFDSRAAAPQVRGTAPAGGDPAARALAFASAHARALGLRGVGGLGTPRRRSVAGVEQLRWVRSYAGIPSFDDTLQVTVGPDGITAVGSADDASPASPTPAIGPVGAMRAVIADAGAAERPAVTSGPRGPRRETGFAGGGRARLVVFGSRLAWRVDYPASRAAFYDTVVDASTGTVLRRANLVRAAAPANVWEDVPGTQQPVDLEQRGYLPPGATTLENAWMHAYSDLDGSDTPGDGEEVGAHGFAFGFQTFDGPGCHPATPCSWDPGTDGSWAANREQDAVQAFYLANVYREHLAAPPFGFDGFAGNDKLRVETEWGAAQWPSSRYFDNSSMLTLPPGYPGRQSTMSLSLFGLRPGFRAIAGGDDASIVFHEYSHGLTDRTVVDDEGVEALNGAQSWAIDEASADFLAKSFLVDRGLEPDTAAPGEVDMGDYTDVARNTLRHQPLDCPVGTPAAPPCPRGGLTYADFGHVAAGPEPHDDGEIWAETMWDLRTRLGSALVAKLYVDALRLVRDEPSFLDLRDAILTADRAVAGQERRADDTAAIWEVFARRGMGYRAATVDGFDESPRADFSLPPAPAAPAAPVATPRSTPAPAAPRPRAQRRPSFSLRASGRRSAAFTVTCRAACAVTGTLTVDAATAKRLRLGRTRIVAELRASMPAETRRFTVRLDAKAAKALRRGRLKSFRATLTARAGYPLAVAAVSRRHVKILR